MYLRRSLRPAATLTLALLAACGDESVAAPTTTVVDDTVLAGQGTGSTIGPDGALYLTKNIDGSLLRLDPSSDRTEVVGTGLPARVIDIGGAVDVAFQGDTAYVLVSLAGKNVDGPDVPMGIYRLGDDGTFSLFADIGAWSEAHLPEDKDWFLSQGVQYSMESWGEHLVVTDAHHGRVLEIDADGAVDALVTFERTDSVPLGLAATGDELELTVAGPTPHIPRASEIRAVDGTDAIRVVGTWGPDYTGKVGLLIDIELGPNDTMYGLLQGYWDLEPTAENEGLPASENTGVLVKVGDDGTFEVVAEGLNQPTSVAISGDTAYVVTNVGTIVKIDGI